MAKGCSKRSDDTTRPIHDYVHRFPLALRIMILISLVLWALPLLLVWGLIYLFYQLPRSIIRKRSRSAVPAPKRVSQPSGPARDYKPDFKSSSTETLINGHSSRPPVVKPPNHIVLARDTDFCRPIQSATVPPSAVYATNRANPSLYSGHDSVKSRRSSFSTDVAHDIVVSSQVYLQIVRLANNE